MLSSEPSSTHSESERLAALARYNVLDTPHERGFDDITLIASQICDVPTALISLVDDKRQWFKSSLGIEAVQTPRDVAFCALAIEQSDTMIVEDASQDPRFADNPLVTGESNLRFYAGAQLITPEGHRLGTLCVLDTRPRQLTLDQVQALEALARQVMTQLEMRRMLIQKHADEKQLRESATRGRLALDAAELGAWEAVPGSSQLFGDARALSLLGHSEDAELSFDTFLAHVHPDDSARFAAAVADAIAGTNDGRLDVEYRVRPKDADGHRWLRSRAQVIKEAGERHRMVGTVRDISAEKAADEHRQLLSNELQHRVKNTLGIVQGIVSQSLRAVATPAEASAAIASRLVTLAHAHDVLTQSSWTAAPIMSVIEGAVLAHLADVARVSVSGPPLELKARAALALSMALHELFTNAVKYGALSNAAGTITLQWTVSRRSEAARIFDFVWQEQGGPTVTSPLRTGFGTSLTGRSLAGDLGGAGVTHYNTDGVQWSLSTELDSICESDNRF